MTQNFFGETVVYFSCLHRAEPSCKKPKKSLEPFLRTCVHKLPTSQLPTNYQPITRVILWYLATRTRRSKTCQHVTSHHRIYQSTQLIQGPLPEFFPKRKRCVGLKRNLLWDVPKHVCSKDIKLILVFTFTPTFRAQEIYHIGRENNKI